MGVITVCHGCNNSVTWCNKGVIQVYTGCHGCNPGAIGVYSIFYMGVIKVLYGCNVENSNQ